MIQIRPLALAALVATSMLALPTFAQTPTDRRLDRADARSTNQDLRIHRGIASGELTAGETRRLERGQTRVDRTVDRAAADGRVTVAEQRRIHAKQDHQSHRIYRKKHNANN